MSDIKRIVLNTSDEELEDVIAPFIEEQFPRFMRSDYRKVVLFIKAYYEWMDSEGKPGYVLGKLDTVSDVDRNTEEFYSHFKNTYLASFPELLATDALGNKPNKKTLLKRIRDFYGNKGTENSYKFLFRVLYDSDLEIYLPKTDILKVSDGQWIEPRSIKTTATNGDNLFSVKNGEAVQYDSGGGLIASASIDSVVQYSFGGFPITEFFLTDINGDFTPNEDVVLRKGSEEYTEKSYSVLGGFNIELPGNGYRVGDIVTVTTSSGKGFSAKVEQIGLAGGIKRIGIINSGVNYATDVTVSIVSETGSQTALVKALRSAVTEYPGYFFGNRGKISSTKRVQDGHYYQDFSYELKSEISFDVCHEVLKHLVHPSGTKMFTSILVKKEIDNTLTSSAQQTTFETPVIGRYTPYASRTFNDLRNGYFLPNQVKGATLQVWLSGYTILGNTSDGVTSGWDSFSQGVTYTTTGATVDRGEFLGIRHWNSIVGGKTFSHPNGYPTSTLWLTPSFKQESINTHGSVRTRPLQYSYEGPAGSANLRSLGFSGPTVGSLGLTLSRSYFGVVKPERVSTAQAWEQSTQAFLVCDSGVSHGIWFGITGGTVCVAAFNIYSSAEKTGVTGPVGATGDWKLISKVYTVAGGNSGPLSLYLNGVCLGTRQSSRLDPAVLAGKDMLIGMRDRTTVSGVFDGEIAEILMYEGALSDADRQKVEGYLAHKYNLDGNLPASHPYKTTPPGASLPAGGWLGATGDFYPVGYNPYIGVSTEIGPSGKSASVGSLFFNSRMGYTYTVMDEFGLTAHNSIGAPLGTTTAWYRSKENQFTPEGMAGLVLWLKPENIGVCGSYVAGACMDVWVDASPSKNNAVPPTWDYWNDVAHLTDTSSAASGWSRFVSDTVTPITKLAVVFNGLCGGFTKGRLVSIGLSENPVSTGSGSPSIPWSLYSYGPYSTLNDNRRVNYYWQDIVNPHEVGHPPRMRSDTLAPANSNFAAYDNTIFEIEYEEPFVVFRVDGVETKRHYIGYGKTYYLDSTFYRATSETGLAGTSVTIKELSYKGKRVAPVFGTVSAGVTTAVYAGVTIDKLRPKLAINHLGVAGATGLSFNGGVLFYPDTQWTGAAGSDGKTLGVKGITFYAGFTGERLLTAQFFNLSKPIFAKETDMFLVFQTAVDSYNHAYWFVCSPTRFTPGVNLATLITEDAVVFTRSWNFSDRDTSVWNTAGNYSISGGVTRYLGGIVSSAVGLFGFRPWAGLTTAASQFKSIVYDPHVSGVCMGIMVGEAARDSTGLMYAWVNGDRATNRSRATGLYVANSAGNASENPFPVSGITMAIGRFGAGVRTTIVAPSSDGFGSQNWVNTAIGNTPYTFRGVLYEVIVFDRKLSEIERQEVYGYISRKYPNIEQRLPDKFYLSHPSTFAQGLTYWDIENHPNNKNLSTIPFGSEFSGISLRKFFTLADSIYKSSGTVLYDGTVLSGDTYTNVGL